MKNTDGNWKAFGMAVYSGPRGHLGDKLICQCFDEDCPEIFPEIFPEGVKVKLPTEDEAFSNATLIALAPELLDTLKWLRECSQAYLMEGDHARKDIEHALDRAAETLAKLEGR